MTAVPDYIGAMFTHLRADAGIVALAAGRISGDATKWSGMPTYGVLVLPAGGTEHIDIGHLLPRIDVWCYGPGRREAMELWRTVHGYLSAANAFKVNGVLVQSVVLEGGPTYAPEQDTNYPRVISAYIMRVANVLVA